MRIYFHFDYKTELPPGISSDRCFYWTVHGGNPPSKNKSFDYLGHLVFNKECPEDHIKARLEKIQVKDFIMANEAFFTNGIRKNLPYKIWGEEWIARVAAIAKAERPDIRLWLNEFRPRDFAMWGHLRDYVTRYNLPIHGIGIQAHTRLFPGLPAIAGLNAIHNCNSILGYQCQQNTAIGKVSAFTEVTCWEENIHKRGKWYRNILELGQQHNIDFACFWTPTENEHWHWKHRNEPPNSNLYHNGEWLFDDWHWTEFDAYLSDRYLLSAYVNKF